MTYECRKLGKNSDNIILFGLVCPIRTTDEGLDRYCSARDEYGNTYDIYTDYDPCIPVSRTVAVRTNERKV